MKKKTIFFKKGARIFSEGDAVHGIYFVYEGSAKIHVHWDDEKDVILRFAKKGDVLGHRGLGQKGVYPISATALEPAKVCYVSNEFLESTLQTNALFTNAFLHFYSNELQKSEQRLRDLVHMNVRGRVALALQEIAAIFGTAADGFISIAIMRQDIASYAGTTYETVFKLMTEFTEKRIIATDGKRIRIIKPAALVKMSSRG